MTYRTIRPWLWTFAISVNLMMLVAMCQQETVQSPEHIIEIVKRDPDPCDRFVMNMDRRHAERVMDIMIASGGYADLPDIVDLEDGRVEIIALRSTE